MMILGRQQMNKIERVRAILAGRPVPKDIKVPVELITRQNAAEFLKGR